MSDIKRIGNHYYDFGCKNDSFLLTAKELQTLGVKNYYFMLRIDNPRVADIDPFKRNITRQEIDALMDELRGNLWFFTRTVVRMRTGKGVVPYCLHRGLAAALWCFEHHYDHCLNEPRQTYKTTGTIGGPVLWAFQTSSNTQMHFFGKETENTKRNLAHLKSNIELLPEWLQFRRYFGDDGKIKKSRQSTEILENSLLKNKLFIHPKPGSLSHAQGMGRGGSGEILYFDEIEHTPYFGEIMSNSAPLFMTASQNAKEAGKPYCRIFTTTPGNLDTREGIESLPIIQSMIPWTEKIYDMTPQQIEEYMSAFQEEYHSGEQKHTREVVKIFYMEYQYYQVRKDYQWVQAQFGLTGDKMEVRREILLQRLRGSNNSPISPEDIEALVSNMRKADDDLLINGKWRFLLYPHGQGMEHGRLKPLDENIPYLVGIDPASGGGGDNFAVMVINPYNLQIAAEFKSPYMGLTPALQMLTTLVQDYIPRAVLVPEKNSMGTYLIQAIVDQTPIADNLYWSEKEADKQLKELAQESPEDRQLREMAQQYKKYGTYNTPTVRKALLEILFRHVKECKQILNTEYLVDDICKLVRTKTGRIEAVNGEHDDCLFAYLHAMYVYYNGDNLEIFGIFKGEHPILGKLVEESETPLISHEEVGGFFSTEQVSFDDEVMKDAARVEEEIQELVRTFNFIRDPVYSKKKESTDPYNNTVSFSPSFFDSLNP